jgi:hypothetical protein
MNQAERGRIARADGSDQVIDGRHAMTPHAIDYAPLDPDAYKHHALMLKSLHCARPVIHGGKSCHIQSAHVGPSGGRVAMTVYLAGSPAPIDSSEITLQEQPK